MKKGLLALLMAGLSASGVQARSWVEFQMPLDLNLTFSGDYLPFAQYRIEPSLGIYALPGLSLGLRYTASSEQADVEDLFPDGAGGYNRELLKINIWTKGYGLFAEYAIRPLTFKDIFRPLIGIAAQSRSYESEILRYSQASGEYERTPKLSTNAVLLHTAWSAMIGLEAEMNDHVAIFIKETSETVWHNLRADYQGFSHGMRTLLGISFRL